MSELKPCPFCGREFFRCQDSHYLPVIRHPYMPGCTLSDTMWEDTPETIVALNRRAQPANEPLTLNELREMDGEPVWVVEKDGTAWWSIVQKCTWIPDLYVVIKPNDPSKYALYTRDYGKTWFAYRYKPKEAQS